MKEALGLVEIQGLSAAILVADAMAKTANINIIGLENTNGFGYMTIKVSGDVGAVNAAVTAGKQIAMENNAFVSAKVIPRPSNNIEIAFCQPKKKEEANLTITGNSITKENSTMKSSNTIEENEVIEDKNNSENSVAISEEISSKIVEKREDKQEEIMDQDKDVIIKSEKDVIQSEEEIIQQNQSDTEISQSQLEEKRITRSSSRKKENKK